MERDRRPFLAGTALFVAALITGTAALTSWKHPGEQLPPPDTTAYGATGRLPAASAVPGEAQAPRPDGRVSGAAAATYTAATSGRAGAAAAGGDPRIPAIMELAYRGAEARLDATAPDCGLSWSLLAGIGKVESDHAQGGNLDDDGTTRTPILGPELDGTDGNAMIADTDRGVLDGDTRWDRAVGPSQFIPTSWDIYGADGNDDGRADPNNAYDAALATGRYLCAGDLHLTDPVDLNTAVFRYNHSQDYVDTVLSFARTYAAGSTGPPLLPPAAPVSPERATVIPVPPLPIAPARPAFKTPTTAPPASSSPGPSTPRAQRDTVAPSPTPAPRNRDAEDQTPRHAGPRSAPARPSHRAAPPAPSHRAGPPTTSSPRPADPAPTSSVPTRRPVPRTTTPETTTETTTPETTTPETTTSESPRTSTSTSPTTGLPAPGAPNCLRPTTAPTTVPTPVPGPELGLPGKALLDDLADAITLLRDCCNER